MSILNNITDPDGLKEHCKVAALIISKMGINAHTKYHIRGAIREATLKVTLNKGSGKHKATLMSVSALEQMKCGNKSGLILEHVVPISVINQLILDLDEPNADMIQNIVVDWSLLSVITNNEDLLLKKAGLSKSMPNDWDGADKYARYKEVGIQVIESKYKELVKIS